ncbi:MAG TPA: type II toxin-antitoxin system VapC family toxin [Gemmataceae bacterium]|nr:type II toxin-antitoxin system VapC family toxin [Gemmataceae bacterium]
MLLDSNIVIYAQKPQHADLRQLSAQNPVAVSAISCVEVLGYHQLTEEDREDFEAFFASTQILPISDAVLQQAVKLRQMKKMALGDAIIAATALVHGETLVTGNAKDFPWIAGLKLLNPFDKSS